MAAGGPGRGGAPNQNDLRDYYVSQLRAGLKRLKDKIRYDFQESPLHNGSDFIQGTFAEQFLRLTNDGRTLFFSHDLDAQNFTTRIFNISLADGNNLGHIEERHVTPRQFEIFERIYQQGINIRTNSRFFGKLDAFVGIFITLVNLCQDIADKRERFTRRRQQQRQILARAQRQLARITLDFDQRTDELDALEIQLAATENAEERQTLITQIERQNNEWKGMKERIKEHSDKIEQIQQNVRERFNYQGLTDLKTVFIGYCYCRTRDRVAVRLMCSSVRIFIQEEFPSRRPYIETAYPDSVLKDEILRTNSEVLSLMIRRHFRTHEEYQHAVLMIIPATFENVQAWNIYYSLRSIPGCIIGDAWNELQQAIVSKDHAGLPVDPHPIDAPNTLRLMGESPAIELLKKESSAANYKRDETVRLYNALTTPPTTKQTEEKDAAIKEAEKLNTKLQDSRTDFVVNSQLTLGQMIGHGSQDRQLLIQVMRTAVNDCPCIRGGPIHRGPRPDRSIIITEPVTPQTTQVPRNEVTEEQPGGSYRAAVLDDQEIEQIFYPENMNQNAATSDVGTMTSKGEDQEDQQQGSSCTRTREE